MVTLDNGDINSDSELGFFAQAERTSPEDRLLLPMPDCPVGTEAFSDSGTLISRSHASSIGLTKRPIRERIALRNLAARKNLCPFCVLRS